MSWRHLTEEQQEWIDKERWGDDLDTTDIEEADEKIITGHILYHIRYYQSQKLEDYRLWDNFRTDFEGWTRATFLAAKAKAVTILRDYLRDHGVFVAIANKRRIAENLADVCENEEFHEWTEEEVEYQMRNGNVFRSRFNPDPTRKEGSVYRVSSTRGTPITPNTIVVDQTPHRTPRLQPLPLPSQPNRLHQQLPSSQLPQQQSQQQLPQRQLPQQQFSQPPQLPGSQQQLPLSPLPQQQLLNDSTAKRITDLEKVYNEEKKFGGGLYDVLDSKLKIFYDNCARIGLPNTMHNIALPTMLKGRASDFYYDQLSGKGYDFDYMVFKLKAHFDTDENRQEYMAEWRETTFPQMIATNPGKSRLEVLQMLFDKLRTVQRGLSADYQTENSLRDQVISACRGVPECSLALYKPSDTFEGVCAELRSAVGTAMRTREEQQQFNLYNEQDQYTETNQFWTDRQYRGRGRFNRGQSRGRYRGNSRGFGKGYSTSRPFQQRQKKCYVCSKPGCWSTKHSLDERKQSFDKFRSEAQYLQNHEPTAQFFQSFLAEFEGIEAFPGDDDLNEAQQLMMEMDLQSEDDEYNGQFFTELGEIDGLKTIAILNNQSTFHAVTKEDVFKAQEGSDDTTDNSVFMLSNRYSSKTFQGILPDTGAAGTHQFG
ncbi:hypothetical protein B0J14DRAFT_642344 [Halenospora varia]|nr:hypothetical protein B0J14DRAFT_642344 [Halenospora varia]